MKLSEIMVGMSVLYVPQHAHGDIHHFDCERGVVFGKNESFAFVRYGGKEQSQATDADDLVAV